MTFSGLLQSFWDMAGAVSVRVKVLGIVVGGVILLGFVITLQMRTALTATLEHELEHQGMAIGENLAATVSNLLAENNLRFIDLLIEETRVHYTDGGHNTVVDFILVTDPQNRILSQSIRNGVVRDELILRGDAIGMGVFRRDTSLGMITEVVFPLKDNRGALQIGFGEDNIEDTVNTITLQIVTLTVIMVGLGFLAAGFLTWILTRPILWLVDATAAVAKGDFTRQVPRWANDEIGALAVAFNSMTRALAQAEREREERAALRERYIRGVIAAQEEERKRIARELHDSTSQSLTSLLVGLRNLEETRDQEILRSRIEDIRRVVNHTLEEVHSLAWQLRPSVLDDLGLVAALEHYIADYQRRYDIRVDFVAQGIHERLLSTAETAVYRIVQEALTNVARHAQASNASVLIDTRNDMLRIIIEDDGVGFDPDQVRAEGRQFGLQGIHERVQLFGGQVTIESGAGQGTSVYTQIPLRLASSTEETEQIL